MNHFRRTVVCKNREWVEIDFQQLQKGDNFRLFDQDGEEIVDEFGNKFMQAKSDPYYDLELECWLVDIE